MMFHGLQRREERKVAISDCGIEKTRCDSVGTDVLGKTDS